MADTTVTMRLKMAAEGADKLAKTAKQTRSDYEGAESASKRIGGTSGSRKAAAAPGGVGEYGAQRGAAGLTGASARDFANQAQGLGGLVRLYATYAANVFAVGAAFRALSGAMDTTNMVRGLDQLGATSGVALGGLSKRLVEATDGAISLRQAMEATAKASSSGMSSEQILRMGEVAKKASQALGVDMADAVSRISRGITKLEPELLDEIGIFTKTGKAADDYAKRIGKTSAQLTDFERRMAFANAVLDEGEKKFGAIKMESNPYTQLLATVKDLSQAGLELVNNVITPFVRFLSSSPAALTTIIAGLAALIVKQAIPAIGEMRNGLRNTAAQALQTAEVFKNSFGDEFQTRLEQRFKLPNIQSQIKSIETAISNQSFGRKVPTELLRLQAGDEKALTKVNDLLAKKNALIETGMAGTRKASAAQIEAAKTEVAYINKVLQLTKLRNEEDLAKQKIQDVADKPLSRLDPEIIALKKYRSLRLQADKAEAISNAAQNAQIVGIRGSWALLNDEIADKGIKGISKYTTLAKGGIAAVGSRVMQLAGAFSNVFMVVGIATSTFSLLDGLLSKTKKEQEAFAGALKSTEEATDNLARTIDNINSKPFLEQLNTESLLAKANAISEIANSSADLINKVQKLQSKLNTSIWDKMIDGVKSLWGGDVQTQFAEGLADTLYGSITTIGSGPQADKIRQEIAKTLQLPKDFSYAALENALKQVPANSKMLTDLKVRLKDLGIEAQVAANKFKEFDDGLKKATEAQKAFAAEYSKADKFTDLGLALVSTAGELAAIMDQPTEALAKFNEIANDTEKLSLFGAEDVSLLLQYKDAMEATAVSTQKNNVALSTAKSELEKYKTELDKIRSENVDQHDPLATLSDAELRNLDPKFREIEAKIAQAEKTVALRMADAQTLEAQAVALVNKFPDLAFNQFKRGAELVGASMVAAASSVGDELKQAVNSTIGNLEGTATAQAEIAKKQIDAQVALITAQKQNVINLKENTAQLAVANARAALDTATANAAQQTDAESRRLGLNVVAVEQQNLDKAKNYLETIQKLSSGQAQSVKDLVAAVQDGTVKVGKEAEELLNFIRSVEGFNLKLTELKGKKAAEDYRAAIAEAKAYYDKQKNYLGDTQEVFNISQDILDNQREAGKISELEYITAKQSLAVLTSETALEQQKLGIVSELYELGMALATGTLSAKQQQAAQERIIFLQQQLSTAEVKTQEDITKKQIAAEKERLKYLYSIADKEQEIAKFKKDTLLIQKQLELDLQDVTLQAEVAAGGLTEQQVRDRQFALDMAKLELDLEKQKSDKRQEYEKAVQDKTRDFIAETDKTKKDQLQQEIIALTERYQLEQSYVDQIGAKRQELLKNEKLNQDWSWLTDGIGDALGKAFTEGSKDFAKNIREVFKEKIKVEISQNVKAGVKGYINSALKGENTGVNAMFSNLINGNLAAAGGNALSIISGLQSKFGAGNFLGGQISELAPTLYTLGFDATSTLVNNFATGMQNAGSLSGMQTAWKEGGATLAGNIAGNILNGMQGLAISDFISGGYQVGNGKIVKAATFVASMFFPVIGGVVAGVFNRAFGRKLADWGIEGVFNAKEGFEGRMFEFYKGGWFRSNKTKYKEMDKELARVIDGQMSLIYEGSKVAAKTLGMSAEQISAALDDYSLDIKISTKGADTPEKFQEALQKGYDKLSDDLATVVLTDLARNDITDMVGKKFTETIDGIMQTIEYSIVDVLDKNGEVIGQNVVKSITENIDGGTLGSDKAKTTTETKQMDDAIKERIKSLQKSGETVTDTLLRLSKSLTEVNNMFGYLGMTLYSANLSGAEMASNLVDLAGGLEQFVANNKFFLENFFTQEEQYTIAFDNVKNMFMGIKDATDLAFSDSQRAAIDALFDGVGDARMEFRNLVASLDMSTEAGQQAYTVLMQLAPAFAGITPAIEDTSIAISNLAVSLSEVNTSELSTVLSEVISGNMENVGERVADAIKSAVFNSLTESFVSQVTSIITTNLITPVLTAVVEGTSVAAAINQTVMDGFVEDAIAKAEAIAEILNNPEFKAAIQKITTTVSGAFTNIGNLFATVSYTFEKLNFEEIDSTLVKAYENEISLLNERKQVLQDELNTAKQLKDRLDSFVKSIKDFKQSLLLSAESPLTPAERYQEAARVFQDISARAAGGDETAQQQLQQAAQDFLSASREYYAQSAQYTSDFNLVQSVLDQIISQAEDQLTEAEQQVLLLEEQVSKLDDQIAKHQEQIDILNKVDKTLTTIGEALALAEKRRAEAYQSGIDQTVEGFTSLDKNMDGILTLEELKASGMASDDKLDELYAMMDTNSDGQITMLEAISGASSGTFFTLQNVEGIMQSVRDGQLTMAQAEILIDKLLAANASTGGTAPGGSSVGSGASIKLPTKAVDDWAVGATIDEQKIPQNFSWTNYLAANKELILAGIDTEAEARRHYALFGANEGRSIGSDLGNISVVRGETNGPIYFDGKTGYKSALGGVVLGNTMYGKDGEFLSRQAANDRIYQMAQEIIAQSRPAMDLYNQFMRWGLDSKTTDYLMNQASGFTLDWFKAYGPDVPSFAVGTNYIPEDMPAMVHKGERIIPAADNTLLMQAIGTKQTNDQELLNEIRRLNQKIEKLEQTIEYGDSINAQATERNTQELSRTIKTSNSVATHTDNIRRRTSIT